MDYQEFLKSKQIINQESGFEIDPGLINPALFQFQKDIDIWSLKKGRSAIFAGCGLGKTAMQLEWSKHVCNHTQGNVLIAAPLSVSQQTVREGEKFGIMVNLCRHRSEVRLGINITNYEMLQHFNPDDFIGVVLDESSILKSYDGKTRTEIIEAFRNTPYKLACTATPAPNDHMELGNHAEFLGVMSQNEMLATFFVHDGGDTSKWRLKGHAVKKYWEWVASWAVMLQKPSDLGYSDDGFILPELRIHQITIPVENTMSGLFAVEAQTLQERQQARRDTVEIRAEMCAEVANQYDEPFIAWCNLNNEADELKKQINNNIEVRGSDSPEKKEKAVAEFLSGTVKKLISKPSIFGFGLNMQHCSKMAFVGLSDSFEEYYQAVRRCWRFGQKNPVDVFIIVAETEGAVVANIKRKEADFEEMLSGMISATQDITKKNIQGTVRQADEYLPKVEMKIPEWLRSEAA